MTDGTTYSIAVRVQRVTTEEAFVRVPVTSYVTTRDADDTGRYHLDGGKVLAAAVELARDDAEWSVESQTIDVHPVQTAPPGLNGGRS